MVLVWSTHSSGYLVCTKKVEGPRKPDRKSMGGRRTEYQRARRAFVEGTSPSRNQTPDNCDTFMDLDEFMKYREETSESLYRAYKGLIPSQSLLETTPDVSSAKEVLPLRRGWYEEWILQLYGPDIIRRCGGLAMGDKRLLPIGLMY